MVTKDEILEKLSLVLDPELGLNIIEMGLIYEIDVREKKEGENQKIFIKMTFTTPACPLMNMMLEQVKQKLDEFKDADIEVSVVFDPPWTPEKMSEEAKLKMGLI